MRRAVAAVLAAAALLVPAAPASSADLVITSVAGTQFAPPQLVVPKGSNLWLVQLDPAAPHDLVSMYARRGKPLFGTKRTLRFGENALVVRVSRLRTGIYPFTCSVHPGMQGQLIVQS